MNRRSFLNKSFGLLTAASIAPAIESSALASVSRDFFDSSDTGALPIMQGMTNDNSTVIVTMIPKGRNYSYLALDGSRKLDLQLIAREERAYSDDVIEKVLIQGLVVSKRYRFLVVEDASGKVIDERDFGAMNGLNHYQRYVVASCMSDILQFDKNRIWKSLVDCDPALVFLLGDTCYADMLCDKTEEGFWKRYSQTRKKLVYFRSKKLFPTLAIWDDHDYGANNGNKLFSGRDIIKALFDIFWGNEPLPGLIKGPGLSFELGAFGQRFFMMDCRYYRDPGKSGGRHWGAGQEDFLFEQLQQNAKPSWIMNGSQVFGGYLKKDSFESDHSENFRQVIQQLSQQKAPVAFVSGDVHFSEIMKIEQKLLGYETFEYTSSSIHSSTWPLNHVDTGKNVRRLMATPAHNFMVFESIPTVNDGWQIKAQSVTRGQKLKFAHQAKIKR